jgi:hypothetical protein
LTAFLNPKAHAAIFCPETCRLGEILWHLSRAEQLLAANCYRFQQEGRFSVNDVTEFGNEVGGDAIHWCDRRQRARKLPCFRDK